MFIDRLHFFVFPLTPTLFTLVYFDVGSNYVFNSDKECKYSSVLFWIPSIHAVLYFDSAARRLIRGMITHCIQISRTFSYF